MSNLSEKIISVRNSKKLSQNKFAISIGYSQSYLADIESGRTRPSRKFLEEVNRKYGISIDWLVSDNIILNLIEANRDTEDPNILFIYAFTQQGIDETELMLRDLLLNKKYMFLDATDTKSSLQFLKRLFNQEKGVGRTLWAQLMNILLNEDMILIVKYISLSKISHSGSFMRKIFKITDDAFDFEASLEAKTQSSLIILDFPSYLERNMKTFGYYAIPIYGRRPRFGHVK